MPKKPTMEGNNMNFSDALTELKNGKQLTRAGWNGQKMFVKLQKPDDNSKMRRPYLYMSPVDAELVPWVASQSDLLGDDWQVVEEEK